MYGAWMQHSNMQVMAMWLGAEVEFDAKLKGCSVRSRDAISHASQVSKQQPNNRLGGMLTYGRDFWDADANPTPPTVHPASPLSSLHWHNLLGSLRFSPRHSNAPQSIQFEPQHWNSNLFPGGNSIRTVEVSAGRKKNIIFVSPPGAAEVARAEAAVAMQCTNGNEAGTSTQPNQPQAAPMTRVSQGRLAESVMQDSSGGTGDISYEVR